VRRRLRVAHGLASPDVDPTAAVDTVINTVDDTAKDVVRDLGQDPNRGTGQVLYAFLLVIIGLIIVFDGFPFPA